MRRLISCVLVISGVLVGAQAAYAEADSVAGTKHFWGGVNLKMWNVSFNPSGDFGASKLNEIAPTVALGWDQFFMTVTMSGKHNYTNAAYPGGTIEIGESSAGLGYNFNSNFGLVLGQKQLDQTYFAPNGTSARIGGSGTQFQTIAGLFNWSIPDSQAYLFGSVGFGKGKTQNFEQVSRSYRGYELGVGYPIYPSLRINAGFKAESFDMPYATSLANALLPGYAGWNNNGTAKKSGLFVGAGYFF